MKMSHVWYRGYLAEMFSNSRFKVKAWSLLFLVTDMFFTIFKKGGK